MKKMILSLMLLLTSCSAVENLRSTATPTITSTPAPTATLTPTNTPEPSNTPQPTKTPEPKCVIDDDFLVRLKQAIPHERFTLSHNIIAGIHTLAVWYVDPEISARVTADNLVRERDLVVERATELGVSLYQVDPCVGRTFDGFNPIVVDENYNGWFSGLLASGEITSSDGDISNLLGLYERPYLIQSPPTTIGEAPAGSCSWEESEERIWWHFSRERQNVAFYFVHDLNGYNVWAQWDGPAFLPLNLPSIMNITMELECLYPEPDFLILMSVGETGELQYFDILELNNGEFNIEDFQGGG